MIFYGSTRRVAKETLNNILKDHPGILGVLLEPTKFNKFCELCTERLNQLDLAGYVRSASAVDKFIRQAAIRYAEKQLEKMGNIKDPGKDVGSSL